MPYRALACDYDATLATRGRVPGTVLEGLEEWRQSGRLLLLVTGRTLDDLRSVFPPLALFSRVVLENGGVVFHPETGHVDLLARMPPEQFVRRLRDRGIQPLTVGQVLVASKLPHDRTMGEAIRELGLELHLVLNRESVMALPSGVTKATGLEAALRQVRVPWEQVVGVGDAENDAAFLERCGRSIAVANAIPSLRESVDQVTRAPEGAGVVEVVRGLLSGAVAGFPKEMTP